MSAGGGAAATVLRLVAGGRAGEREAAIAAALEAGRRSAVILEGLPDGRSGLLEALARAAPSDAAPAPSDILHLAPGCLCCAGNLVLRVSLNRILRRRPERLFIGLANPEHLEQLRQWLRGAPYESLLRVGADLAPLRGA